MSEFVFETDVHNETFWEELRLQSLLAKLVFLIALCGTLFCLVVGFGEAFAALRGPLSPDVGHGLVVPFNNHGVLHYISRTRSWWLDTAFTLYFLFFMVVMLFAVRAKLLRK